MGIRSAFSRVLWIQLFWGTTFFGVAHAAVSYSQITDRSDFSYEKLKKLIEDGEHTTVEQTLEVTKAHYPDFFENYILMYHSRSLQGSSFEAPRALLFDRSGQFVFSFNGKADQRGYDRLEIMQFREEQNRFEFREITFVEGERPQFSEPNPAKCMVCHQDTQRKNIDPRPNWEPYNIWPGAFGSNSGRMEALGYALKELRFQSADPLMLENMAIEKMKATEFFNSIQPTHARYRFLEKEKFDPHQTVDFTQMMANLNARRVIRLVQQDLTEYYKYIEPAFLGLIKCGVFMVKPEVYEWMQQNWPYPEVADGKIYLEHPPIKTIEEIQRELRVRATGELREINKEELEKLAQGIYERQFEILNKPYSISISQGLHHLFEPFGISTKDWSTDFMTGGKLAFRERFGTPSNTLNTFRAAYKKVTNEKFDSYVCTDLQEKAEKGMDDFMKSELFTRLQEEKLQLEAQANASILSRCVKCHTSGDSYIPQIAFDNPEKLKNQLQGPATFSKRTLIEEIRYRLGSYAKESERMPLGPVTTPKQREDLVKYLEGLVLQGQLQH